MAQKAATYGADIMRMAEKSLLLQLLDQSWKDHLYAMDMLKNGIGLQAFAERDRSAEEPIRVRIGLHTGEVTKEGSDFFGKHVNLAARIASYELAARMQLAAPEAMDLSLEPDWLLNRYGVRRNPPT